MNVTPNNCPSFYYCGEIIQFRCRIRLFVLHVRQYQLFSVSCDLTLEQIGHPLIVHRPRLRWVVTFSYPSPFGLLSWQQNCRALRSSKKLKKCSIWYVMSKGSKLYVEKSTVCNKNKKPNTKSQAALGQYHAGYPLHIVHFEI